MNKKEYKKKFDEKIGLISAAIDENDNLKALTAINEQCDYVLQIAKKVNNSIFIKWVNEYNRVDEEADRINNAKKTPFMMKLKDLSTAVFITMWVALLMSVIMIFLGLRSGLGIIIAFWCSYIFYYGIRSYLKITFKVKFPKIKRKDKKAGLFLLKERVQELNIAKAMYQLYENYKENHD